MAGLDLGRVLFAVLGMQFTRHDVAAKIVGKRVALLAQFSEFLTP